MRSLIIALTLALAIAAATGPCRADNFVVIGAVDMHLVTMNTATREVTDYVYDLTANTNSSVERGRLPVLGPNFAPAGIALIDDIRWPVAIWMFDRVAGRMMVCRATTGKVFACQ
jgi:hypothetical protein